MTRASCLGRSSGGEERCAQSVDQERQKGAEEPLFEEPCKAGWLIVERAMFFSQLYLAPPPEHSDERTEDDEESD